MLKNYLNTIWLFFIAIQVLQAQSVYVSPNGNDNNSGEVNNEFATIAHALSELKNRMVVPHLKAGTYHEELVLANYQNITIKPYLTDEVILDGTVAINGSWTETSPGSNIYVTSWSQDIWQLFIDNEQQVNARWPNAQFYDDNFRY